jgi:serine/threonine protein phosphatase PrpC
VAHVDATGIVDENVDRGLVRMLADKSALDFFGSHPDNKKWSIATETDQDLHRRASFGDKSINAKGSQFDGSKHGVGFACKKGLKPVSPNQDSFLLLQVEGGVGIYGVFDGHGRGGHDVSNFVKDILPKLILSHPGFHDEDLTETLTYAFHETQKLLDHQTKLGIFNASTSGTTGTVAVFRPQSNTLWVAHVGDSRCVLGIRDNSTGKIKGIDITADHKPDLPHEHERIIANGGAVVKPPMDFNHRVYVKGQKYPGLAMSRALGDLVGYKQAGISCTPDVSCFKIDTANEATLIKVGPAAAATMVKSNAHPDSFGGNHQGHKAGYLAGEESSDDEERGDNFSNHSDDTTIPPFMNAAATGSGTSNNENTPPATATAGAGGEKGRFEAFLLLCSDGVWEFISSHEAVRIASKFAKAKAPVAAEELARVSWDRWMIEENGHVVDDITALVVHL